MQNTLIFGICVLIFRHLIITCDYSVSFYYDKMLIFVSNQSVKKANFYFTNSEKHMLKSIKKWLQKNCTKLWRTTNWLIWKHSYFEEKKNE